MNSKTKLLFVAEELSTNGAMMSMMALLKSLPQDKYDINLFLFEHGGAMISDLPSNVHLLPEILHYSVHRLPTKHAFIKALKNYRFDLLMYRLLVSLQRRLSLDFNMWWWLPEIKGEFDVVFSYSDGFAAPVINKKIKAGKKCCWVHVPYTHYPLMRCEYNALKKADACVLVSKQVGIELENAMGCKSATQYIVHNIIDEKTCIERAKESCEEPRKIGISRIVSVGRVTPAKGFDIICPTAKILAEHDMNFEWYIIGEGEDREKLIRHVKEKKMQDNVHFIGNKPNPMPWVNSADVIVQPSIFESWGMTITEALCLGKAIVASDLPVFKEQISDGVNGLLRPNIPSVLAETIADVLSNADLRYKLESKAKSNLVTKEMVIDEFNTMIDKLIMQY